MVFGSPTVFEKYSNDIFGYKIAASTPFKIINGEQKNTRRDNLTFSYITRDEFNRIKNEYPERAFGNIFENLIPQVRKKAS